MKLLFNINAEFAHSLDARPIELRSSEATPQTDEMYRSTGAWID